MKQVYSPFTKVGKTFTQGSLSDGVALWGQGYTTLDVVESIEKEAVLTSVSDILQQIQELLDQMDEEIVEGWAKLEKQRETFS